MTGQTNKHAHGVKTFYSICKKPVEFCRHDTLLVESSQPKNKHGVCESPTLEVFDQIPVDGKRKKKVSIVFLYVPVALQALKRKKRLEQQLTQIDGTLSTIEFQREALENSHTNTEVLKNMGFAARALEAVHKKMYDMINSPS